MRFFRRHFTERREHDRIGREIQPASNGDRARQQRPALPAPPCGAFRRAPPGILLGRSAATIEPCTHTNRACAHDDAPHRPEVVNRPTEPESRILREVGVRHRMVVTEFTTVVVDALVLEQLPRACMVQLGVVQHDEPRIARVCKPTDSRGSSRCPADKRSNRRAFDGDARRSRRGGFRIQNR